MKTLHVLFDRECALCRRCRRWLERQPAFLELRFHALQDPETLCRFPGIEEYHPHEQLLVVSDEGGVYQGSHAWIMCLYALREYREWSQRLSGPALLPLARRACQLVSENRSGISSWFRSMNDEQLGHELAVRHGPACREDGRCG